MDTLQKIIVWLSELDINWWAVVASALFFRLVENKAYQINYWLWVLLHLPGTFLHELSHFTVGLITGARPTWFSIFPSRTENGVRMGYVTLSRLNGFNNFPTSMAPFLVLFLPFWAINTNWFLTLSLTQQIGIATTLGLASNSGIPSSVDFRNLFSTPIGTIIWIAVISTLIYWSFD